MSARNHAPRVVICGGGVAAVESLLALRALRKVAVEVHMVAPNRGFVYHPLAVAAPFDLAETTLLDIAEIADDQGAELHVDSLTRVDVADRSVRLASGLVLPYDALIVAIGARRRNWLEGALHFGGAADVEPFRVLLRRLESGSDQRLAFVSPAGVSWTLPLFELALLTASHLADRGVVGVELAVVTPEAEPLAVFGPAAGRMLRDLLADRGVVLRAGARAENIHDGQLYLDPRGTLEVDQVVALSQLVGPAVPGLPSDAAGFIAVDEHSQVKGLKDVYAAGDGTTFPIKQGGIATQQADAAAQAIAAGMGVSFVPSRIRPTLRGMLLTGIAPSYMRADMDGPNGTSFELASSPLWWPPSKIAGRYLAPYLAGHNALTRDETLRDRPPSTRDHASLRASHADSRALALLFAERDAADRHFKSALEWLEVSRQLDGVLPPGYLRKRAEWQGRALQERT